MGYKPQFTVISDIEDKNIGRKSVIPEHVLSFISEREKKGDVISEYEAHYICAILNSSPIRSIIDSLSQKGKSGLTKTLLSRIKLEKFDKKNNLHQKLSELSKKAHRAAKENDETSIKKIEKEIDDTVLLLYTKKEKQNLEKWLHN
jgi:hypothetical protein